MVQPKSSPLSIRIPPDLLEQIDRAAAERKLTRHAMILKMLSAGFLEHAPLGVKTVPPSPMSWPSGVLIEPGHKEDPGPGNGVMVFQRKPFNPQPKAGKKR